MSDPIEFAGPESAPLKRSVFRPHVLQREIERRDGAVVLDEVPRMSTVALVAWIAGLMLTIIALMLMPVTLSSGAALAALGATITGEDVRLILSAEERHLITRGSVLTVEVLPTAPLIHLRVLGVDALAPADASGPALAVTVLAKDSSIAAPGAVGTTRLRVVAVQTRFINCLAALVCARHA